jgi:hypothetical protein
MKKLLSGLLALGILAVCLLGVVLATRGLVHWFTGLGKDQALALVALGGLVLTPLISFATTRAIETKKLTGQAALDHKIALYEGFVEFFVEMMGLSGGPGLNEDKIKERMAAMTPAMLIYASNDFLKQWREFKKVSNNGVEGAALVFQMENVLKALRKDLGHSSFLSTKGDILAIFVNDIEDIVK